MGNAEYDPLPPEPFLPVVDGNMPRHHFHPKS